MICQPVGLNVHTGGERSRRVDESQPAGVTLFNETDSEYSCQVSVMTIMSRWPSTIAWHIVAALLATERAFMQTNVIPSVVVGTRVTRIAATFVVVYVGEVDHVVAAIACG